MASEIYVDDGFDFKVDVYATGILMFVVLTRLEPFPICRNQMVLGRRVLKGDRPKIPDSVGARYARLIQQCSEIVTNLARGFRRTLGESGSDAPTPAAVSSKESASRRISRRQGDTFKKALKRKILTLALASLTNSLMARVCKSIAQWRLRTGDLEQRRAFHGRALTSAKCMRKESDCQHRRKMPPPRPYGPQRQGSSQSIAEVRKLDIRAIALGSLQALGSSRGCQEALRRGTS
jgi:hypothetical protein